MPSSGLRIAPEKHPRKNKITRLMPAYSNQLSVAQEITVSTPIRESDIDYQLTDDRLTITLPDHTIATLQREGAFFKVTAESLRCLAGPGELVLGFLVELEEVIVSTDDRDELRRINAENIDFGSGGLGLFGQIFTRFPVIRNLAEKHRTSVEMRRGEVQEQEQANGPVEIAVRSWNPAPGLPIDDDFGRRTPRRVRIADIIIPADYGNTHKDILDTALVASLREHGQLNPIAVTPPPRMELLAGLNRMRGQESLGRDYVDALFYNIPDEKISEVRLDFDIHREHTTEEGAPVCRLLFN